MILKKLKLKNIRSYEDSEIEFPSGSVLLSGDIGTGKTTILLAIEFALFGLQPGQKGASILKNGKSSGTVELEFQVGNSNIIVTRILKRSKSVNQESTFISIDGKKEEKSITEIKNTVLNLINYPSEFTKKTNLLYRFTVYTPQEEMKQIILENPEIRLNILRHIFGIDKYKRIKENSQILLPKLRETSRIKHAEITNLEQIKFSFNEKKNFLKNVKTKIQEINKKTKISLTEIKKKESEIEEINEKIKEKNKFENEIEKTVLLLSTKKEQNSKLENEITELTKRFSELNNKFDKNELNQILNNLEELTHEIEQKKKQNLEFNFKKDSLNNKLLELNNLIEKISHLKTCPTCLQIVSSEHKNNLFDQTEKEITKFTHENKILTNKKQQIEKELQLLDNKFLELNEKKIFFESMQTRLAALEETHKNPEELEKQKISLEKDIILLEDQISLLKDSIIKLSKFNNLIEIKETELTNLNIKHRELELDKARLEKETELVKIEIESLSREILEKENIKLEIVYINELESWLTKNFLELVSKVEQNVMIRLRSEFSSLFSKWFSVLVPDTFIVKLDDNFTPVIEQQGFELDYDFLSGGEKTAIALAYRLALNQTINSILSEIKTKGLVILDEPTSGFSQQQLDKMRDVLAQLDVEQLIIVSHDQKMETFVDNIIKLSKNQGISQISG
tara:strand:+ start:14780 stop:16825 length:2046 start_codon:yes stop_codon:yes gene_type:complete